jgi:hypothetical protein
MKVDVDLLRDDLPAVSSKLLSLQNGIDFLGGDLADVLTGVKRAGSSSAVARTVILAAESEDATVQVEAT